MLAFKIIALVLGLVFLSFGYHIYFRKRYFLINGFQEQYRQGVKTEKWARRVGLIELIVGIVWLTVAVALLIFA